MKIRIPNNPIKKLKIKKWIFFLFALILLLSTTSVVLAYSLFMPQNPSVAFQKSDSLDDIAQSVIKQCANSNYKPGCYDKIIPLTMKTISMEDAFKVTQIIQKEDTSYAYCHVLGHELSAKEVEKNPNNWRQVISRCPSGVCSNGCIHGAMQQKFRSESLTDTQIQQYKGEFASICEETATWKPTGLEQASCYHALGHLMMYVTNADIKKSIGLCNELAVKKDGRDYTRLCYDGSFMQIYQPLEPEDFALIKGKEVAKEKVQTFCDSFEPASKSSCLSESWPLFRPEVEKPDGLITFCSMQDSTEKDRCYSAMFYVLTATLNFDVAKISSFCTQLPPGINEQCFASSASRFIETDYRYIDNAGKLCQQAEALNLGTNCFEELITYSTYNFHPGSQEALSLCSRLPAPWNTKCKANNT
jgi:hypothetical protein